MSLFLNKMSFPKKKKSHLWNHFTPVDGEFAKCDICQAKLSYKTTNSNLKKHMVRRHPFVKLQPKTNVLLSPSKLEKTSTMVVHSAESSEGERTPVFIKEEIDVPQDDDFISSPKPGPSEEEIQMEFENEQQPNFMGDRNIKSESVNSQTEIAGLKEQSNNPDKNRGMSDILKIADGLSLDAKNILTDKLFNLSNINPINSVQARLSLLNPGTNVGIKPGCFKSEFTDLEAKLRIHYLNTIIKKEEELINLKLNLYKLQMKREEIEINNIKKTQSLRVENLELENALLKSKLEKKCNCNCSC